MINNTKLLYKENIINNFCEKYKISKQDLISNNDNYFRYICFKYNDFMQHIELPKIPQKSYYEAVLIEFREFPHLEFLIRNSIFKLGEKWAQTVICGNGNYDFIVNICKSISENINIIRLNVDNMTVSQYNKFLTSLNFWNTLYGEKILIYQENSIIFYKNIDNFIKYDYIGAPFIKYKNDNSNLVGDGGFSLRTKSIMIKILNTISVNDTVFNPHTYEEMEKKKITFPPEDVYYSKNLQELGIGIVADYEKAKQFSCESIFSENSLGGHRFWLSDSKWKNKLKIVFNYSAYIPNSDILLYLKFCNLSEKHNKNPTIKNAFDIDLYFCNIVNNLLMDKKEDIMKYVQLIGLDGFIYHSKQLTNIFPNIKIYSFMNNVFIMYQLKIYSAYNFVNTYLYNNSYDNLCSLFIRKRFYNLNEDIPLLILVFIGNEERGNDLIDKLIEYQKIQKFNIAFCFNLNSNIASKMKPKIKDNFSYYAVYESKECGTDITPTILMYDDISRQNKFKHIIKLQSKSIYDAYLNLTNFLLDVPLESLILQKNKKCNCIGHPDYYIKLNDDVFNNELKLRHLIEININNEFVGGTIFYCEDWVFNKTLQFIKKNYKSYLFNNLYENNSININNSPIHFLERVFGAIKNG